MSEIRQPTTSPSLVLTLTSLFRADFIVLIKSRARMIFSILLPILLLIITNSKIGIGHFGGSEYIIGLSIAYGLASTSIMGYTVNVARDRETGVFQLLRCTPAPAWTIMASRLAVQTVSNLIIALVVVIVGAQMHHLSLSANQYVLVLVASIIGGAVFLAIGQALVGMVKSADTVNAAARLVYIGLVALGLFGASGALGSTWESIARWTPVGAVMTVFAGVLNLSAWSGHDSLSLLTCVGYIVVCAAIGIRWFRWETR
ncbi:MAG TPA: ABC transporter permease [Verrucomicrobiae bacterium]|nr:ABC transporter permease [Verrucomicrobiae bacterium]